jgi:hypothetical protein
MVSHIPFEAQRRMKAVITRACIGYNADGAVCYTTERGEGSAACSASPYGELRRAVYQEQMSAPEFEFTRLNERETRFLTNNFRLTFTTAQSMSSRSKTLTGGVAYSQNRSQSLLRD